MASALYFVIQQVASLLCLGSRVPLETVAQDSCPCAKCIAVVWSLEVSCWAFVCCARKDGLYCPVAPCESKMGSGPKALLSLNSLLARTAPPVPC